MKRYPAYEFPEYVNWAPDSAVQAQFEARLVADPERAALIDDLDEAALLDLYRGLLSARLHDIQLKRWVKQGVLTKAWLGSGEEAVTVGNCAALRSEDVVGPMIRNGSALIERGIPLVSCFAGYLGTTDSITRGRDLHIGDPDKGVIPPISHIGDIVPVMAGCALSFKIRGEARVAVVWTGDGSTATGAVHEGLRVAASTQAPLVCVIQNNGVALGTRADHHFRGEAFEALGPAYGLPTESMDGNNVLDCYAAMALASQRAREGAGPQLLVANTFRMGGHATHDEREARQLFDDATFEYWGKRDPIGMYETWLRDRKQISVETLAAIEARITDEMDAAAREAAATRADRQPDPATQAEGVYA